MHKIGQARPSSIDDDFKWLNVKGVEKRWAHIWINPNGSLLDVAIIDTVDGDLHDRIQAVRRIVRYKAPEGATGGQHYYYHFIAQGLKKGEVYFLKIVDSIDRTYDKNMLHFRNREDTELSTCSPGFTAYYDIAYCYTCGTKKLLYGGICLNSTINYIVIGDYMFFCHSACQSCNKRYSRYDCTSCASGFENTTTFPIFYNYKSYTYNDHHDLQGCFCPNQKMESDGICQDYCDYGHYGVVPHYVAHGMYEKLEKQICIRSCPYSYPGVKRFKYDAF